MPADVMPAVDDDSEVMAFFDKYSYDEYPSKHLKYFVIPAFDMREALEEHEVLHMSDKGVNDDDCVALGRALSLIRPETLRRVYMTRNKLTSKGCAALAGGCAACPNFEVFYAQKNAIGDEGLAGLARSLKPTRVWQIVLSENEIGDAGVKALAQAIGEGSGFASLTHLYLDQNKGISDEGAVALAAVLHRLPLLEMLGLHKCSIGDTGIRALADAVRKGAMPRGDYLYVFDNPFGAEAKATLRAACRDRGDAGVDLKAHVGWPPPMPGVDYEAP